MRFIHDGDGNHQSDCGRISISRRYAPGGSHPCIGWGVDVEGESGNAHLANSFASARAWANEEARARGWGVRLRWEVRAPGHHIAFLPDGAILVAILGSTEMPERWQCHRKRGEDRRLVATADSFRGLMALVGEMGEGAYL